MKTDYVLIGERIKFWRQQRSLTQEQLAEMIELTPGFISLIETGKNESIAIYLITDQAPISDY